MSENEQPIDYPIDGTLDLHQFKPEDTKDVVNEYIRECLNQNIYQIPPAMRPWKLDTPPIT